VIDFDRFRLIHDMWNPVGDDVSCGGIIARASGDMAEATAVALLGLKDRVVPVTDSSRARVDGMYLVEQIRVEPYQGRSTRWRWDAQLRRLTGASGRAEGVFRGGSRADWPLVWPDAASQWRPWAAVPGSATGLVFPAGVDATFTRSGPGGDVTIGWHSDGTTDLYNGGLVTYSLRPEHWYDMAAQVVDAAGVPITRPGQELPPGWKMSNGLTEWYPYSTGFKLRGPQVADTSLWNEGWFLQLVTFAFGSPSATTRQWLVDPGPASAVVGTELAFDSGEMLIMHHRLRRGARGVTVEGRSGIAAQWGWNLTTPIAVDGTVVIESEVVARMTSTAVDGSKLVIVPMSAESELFGTNTVREVGDRQLTAWHLGYEFDASSPETGDTEHNIVRQAWGAAGEAMRVGQ
jgi:hypothetical protein